MRKLDALLQSLIGLYQQLRSARRERWRRDLPFDELLFDRWERAESLGFGAASSIYHNSYIYGDVRIGEHTWVGPYTLLDGIAGLVIGSYCNISAGVQIYTHDTVKWVVSGGKASYEYAPVRIGDCCYIGPQTVITRGVTIGEHSIIGACSFVNRDIPAYSIAVGAPCRVVGEVAVDENGSVTLRYLKRPGDNDR